MKHKNMLKLVATMLAVVMLVGSIPFAAFATNVSGTNTETTVKAEKELTPAETIEKEVAARSAITKDRSAGSPGPYAVYVDGKFYKNGQFSDMWNLAMELAPYVVEDDEHKNVGKHDTVEFVLYTDIRYTSKWFGEKTMTVSNKKFTIDLNGHLLSRAPGDNGSVIKVEDNSILTIMDSNPKRQIAGNIVDYGMWSYAQGGSKKISGGVISGGYLKTDDGGGIHISGNSTVYLLGGTIAGNKADVGSAVYLEDASTLDMSRGNSQICYNYSAGTSTDGGAIFLRSDCTVIGGYVHHNLADDYGGGVRAKGGNILIKDVIIYANKAEEYGGGLYIERSGTNQTVTVSGCKIIGNYAAISGGGAYLYDLLQVNMSDCWAESNSANREGAGIQVSDWTGTVLEVSGKMVVRNNYRSKDNVTIKCNIYLEGDNDLIAGSLSIGSEIWVRTEENASGYNGVNHPLTAQTTSTSPFFFFADEDGYCVKYQNDSTKKNYRHLYLERGTRTDKDLKVLEDYSTKKLSTPYLVGTGEYGGVEMPLYKGYFEYDLMTNSEYYSASPFYYSDGYFLENPEEYNTHLATMSINMAVAAFGRSTTHVGDNTYANHFANVKQLFADIGCDDVNFFANEDYQMKPAYYGEEGRLSTIGVAISQKKITVKGDTYTLVPVAIRGGGYESEWSSNVSIGVKGEAKGFSDAANQVYGHIQNYIADYGLTEEVENGKVKFWVVGYSRAGATANLTSKRLVDSYTSTGNQVYGYTFEAPMGGVESAKTTNEYTGYGTYPTIHNTVNELDFVTLVAPSEMGFIRYGVDHLVGSTGHENGLDSAYSTQKSKMISQLQAMSPYYEFDDSWQVAELSLIYGTLFGDGTIDTEMQWWDDPNPETENMYEFLRWFFLRVQADGFNIPTYTAADPKNPSKTITVFDDEMSRSFYATYQPLMSVAKNTVPYSDPNYNFGYSTYTVEQAAAELVSLLMGSLTDEQLDELLTIVSGGVATTIGNYAKSELLGELAWVAVIGIIPTIIKIVKDLYDLMVVDWDTHSEVEKAEIINQMMHLIADCEVDGRKIWDVLDEKQCKAIAEGVPVVIWFALNIVSNDYNSTDTDDGMWGIPTFLTNASSITSNHYQEVSVAWVRSYDDYYSNSADMQAYRLDTTKIVNKAPTGTFASATNTLSLSGEAGSSIFYSIDGGESWTLYTKPVSLEQHFDQILCFSIYRGVKSEVREISMNGWAGSMLGNGNIWFLITGSALVVAISVAALEMNRKKKKAHN